MNTATMLTGIPAEQLSDWVQRTNTPPLLPIGSIRRHHRGHFFDAEAMRFFRSRLPDTGYALPNGGAVFTTSEQHVSYTPGYHADPRAYTVRVQTPGGDIAGTPHRVEDRLGLAFQQYASNSAAQRVARAWALTAWTEPETWADTMRELAGMQWRPREIAGLFGVSYQRVASILKATDCAHAVASDCPHYS